MEGQHPILVIEPKGHGVSSYSAGKPEQSRKMGKTLLTYVYSGTADDPDRVQGDNVGYDLQSIYETLWQQAQAGENDTFGEAAEYQKFTVSMQRLDGTDANLEPQLGKLGSAFRGNVGFKNKARPPWGWFDESEKDRPLGEWFFNPAAIIARHFNLDQTFSQIYSYHPYLKIFAAEQSH
jgi:hypothetical protein